MISDLEKFENVASMLPGSVLIFQLEVNDSMKVLFYSHKAQEITGVEQDEVDKTIFADGFNMIIESDQKVIAEKIKYAIEHHTEMDVIYRQHHKVQGVVWIHMKARIAGELNDKPVFIATMLDVTAEMLSSSSIMEASDRCICVIEKKTKLMLYANAKFYELIERDPTESMGCYCYDVLCGAPEHGRDEHCLCFSTVNIEKPFEYYNPDTKKYISMYGREIMWGEREAYVFFLNDQTEEKFKEKQLRSAQERFEMTLDNSDLFVWEYDIINSQCINPQKAVREYGLPPIIDNYPESLYDMGHTPPETVEQIKEVKQRLLNGETGFSVERRTINSKGESQWMKVSYALEKDATGRPIRALVCGADITEQKKKQWEYEEDALTSVCNRSSFEQKVKLILSERRNSYLQCAFLILDLDGFKQINDTYGHGTGDKVLISVGTAMKKTFRSTDIVGRLGGDEFTVFMTSIGRKEDVERKANELVANIRKISENEGFPFPTTCSVGVAIGVKGKDDLALMYKKADLALYEAKNAGKNRYWVYDSFSDAKRKILIVDDIEINRSILKKSLSAEYKVLEAENGVDALRVINETQGIILIITDIVMPEMDGIELIRKIRDDENLKDMAIIAETQVGDTTIEKEILELGVDDFIYKAASPGIIQMRVRNIMKSRGLQMHMVMR